MAVGIPAACLLCSRRTVPGLIIGHSVTKLQVHSMSLLPRTGQSAGGHVVHSGHARARTPRTAQPWAHERIAHAWPIEMQAAQSHTAVAANTRSVEARVCVSKAASCSCVCAQVCSAGQPPHQGDAHLKRMQLPCKHCPKEAPPLSEACGPSSATREVSWTCLCRRRVASSSSRQTPLRPKLTLMLQSGDVRAGQSGRGRPGRARRREPGHHHAAQTTQQAVH